MKKNSSVKKQLGFIRLLLSIPCSKRGKVIKHCKKPQIDALSEIVLNFLKRNLTKNKKVIKTLSPLKKILHTITLKKTPTAKKKKIFSSSRGAGILSILLPLVGTLFSVLKK